MSDVLMVLFEILPSGEQQVISSQTFGSREDAIKAFDEMTASTFVGPGCHNYQLDLVDRQSITDLVEVYIPNTNDAINWGNHVWETWQSFKTGDIAVPNLGGDFTNSHPADTDCRVPTIEDFKPTPGDGGSPAVALLTASVDPTPTPLPPTTPTATTSQLVALTGTATALPDTGATYTGPMADVAVALMALGAVAVWLGRKFHAAK